MTDTEITEPKPTAEASINLWPTYRMPLFTVGLIVTIIALVGFVTRIQHVLELFTIGIFLSIAINPLVCWMEKRGVSRMISVFGLLLLIIAALTVAAWLIVPRLVNEGAHFVDDAPKYLADLSRQVESLETRFPTLKHNNVVERLEEQAQASISGLWGTLTTVFTASITAVMESVLVLLMIVFILLDPKGVVGGFRGLMPDAWQSEAERITLMAVGKVQAWIQGSFIMMIVIGIADCIGLALLGVPYALLWGVLSGLLEVIPTVGPIAAAIPPVLVAFSIDPMLALWVIVLYTAMQQMESAILMPLVMSNKVRLHPITLLFFLLVMTEYLGIFGAIIATPVAAILKVLYLELYYRRVHGDIPPEEKDDPVRKRVIRLRRKKKAETAA